MRLAEGWPWLLQAEWLFAGGCAIWQRTGPSVFLGPDIHRAVFLLYIDVATVGRPTVAATDAHLFPVANSNHQPSRLAADDGRNTTSGSNNPHPKRSAITERFPMID